MNFSKAEIQKYVGNIKQLADIRTSVLDDGKGRGVRIADFHNSSGLQFSVLPDRAMDIGYASYKGTPLSFLTPGGYANPSFYEPRGFGWLRNWSGGLMTTCGLNNVGTPGHDDYSRVEGPDGLHGRISNTPAEILSQTKEWHNNKFVLSIKGVIRDACLFGRNMELHREIKTHLGESTIEIIDEVRNLSYQTENLKILYHINLGYPFLSESAVLKINNSEVVARDDEAKKGIANWSTFEKPSENYNEQVFFHNIPGDPGASAILYNPDLNLSFSVEYSKDTLPNFWQWKEMCTGTYVLGMEPTNVGMDSYGKESEEYTSIKGYSSKIFKIKISIN